MAAISIVWLLYNCNHNWVFNTEFGDIPILELSVYSSNKKLNRKFVEDLEVLISMAQGKRDIPEDRLLPAILEEHRRLRDEGVISNESYEQAKVNILGNHQN